MVEAGGFEPPSENSDTWASPSAVTHFNFGDGFAEWRADPAPSLIDLLPLAPGGDLRRIPLKLSASHATWAMEW